MGTPFLAELRLFSSSPVPTGDGWANADGQTLAINQNQALFSLLGTMYGGNGQTTFALPDLRGRLALHRGPSLSSEGQVTGQETHTLTQSEMPAHTHLIQASSLSGNQALPGGNLLASANDVYRPAGNDLTPIEPSTISTTGGSQPHENRQPYLVLCWGIALQGVFPSRN